MDWYGEVNKMEKRRKPVVSFCFLILPDVAEQHHTPATMPSHHDGVDPKTLGQSKPFPPFCCFSSGVAMAAGKELHRDFPRLQEMWGAFYFFSKIYLTSPKLVLSEPPQGNEKSWLSGQ